MSNCVPARVATTRHWQLCRFYTGAQKCRRRKSTNRPIHTDIERTLGGFDTKQTAPNDVLFYWKRSGYTDKLPAYRPLRLHPTWYFISNTVQHSRIVQTRSATRSCRDPGTAVIHFWLLGCVCLGQQRVTSAGSGGRRDTPRPPPSLLRINQLCDFFESVKGFGTGRPRKTVFPIVFFHRP